MNPLELIASPLPLTENLIIECMQHYGVERSKAIDMLENEAARTTYYLNDKYQVAFRVWENYCSAFSGENTKPTRFFQINIRRRDGNIIRRDWREFQAIKNQLVGPEVEAIELYPAESRLVDTGNKYHLWGILDPKHRFPFGWHDRDVVEETIEGSAGFRQRGRK